MKKLIFKQIIFTLLIITSACSLLEVDSKSDITSGNFWRSETEANAALTGIYANFRGFHDKAWTFGELRSGIWGGLTFEAPSNLDFIQFNYTEATAPYGGWAELYTFIYRTNDFLENVPDITFSNDKSKSHMMAQVHAIRAYYYFTLLRVWGKVPITLETLKTTDPENLEKERAPKAEVVDIIKSDIEKSLEYYDSNNEFWNTNRNYWSRLATLMLKGEVYAWSARVLNGGNEDLLIAKNAFNEVLGGEVVLEKNFEDIWKVGNKDNHEFIFSLNFELDQATNVFSNITGRSTEVWASFNQKGESMEGIIVNGASRYGPSTKTLQIMDDTLDTRRDVTFIRLYANDNDGKGYPEFDKENYSTSMFGKFFGSVVGTQRVADNDIPVYRAADAILMLAEVKNYLGEDPSSEINMIRQRAYGENYDVGKHAYQNTSQHENIEAILLERYKEFVGEGKRFWDLRRAGDNYLINHVDEIDASNLYKIKLPITLDMIGRNPLLEQTQGYN